MKMTKLSFCYVCEHHSPFGCIPMNSEEIRCCPWNQYKYDHHQDNFQTVEWISTKDRLPEQVECLNGHHRESDVVLCFVPADDGGDGFIIMLSLASRASDGFSSKEWMNDEGNGWPFDCVTHWMPKPKPPVTN